MVKLLSEDILTREVLDWEGLHLFHFWGSSCSQKTRICFNLKDIRWNSHVIDLGKGENYTDYYLGINPRGLVPTLVLDGEVYIESNDIITLIDERFPKHPLIPDGSEAEIAKLLGQEDELHLDLRTITFRFTQPRGKEPRSKETLQQYRDGGSGTVLGMADSDKEREIDFWETVAELGITDDAIRTSVGRFKTKFEELDNSLVENINLLGATVTVFDVAWVIYVNRLVRCGYPLERLHPNLDRWFWSLRNRQEFDKELTVSPDLQKVVENHHALQRKSGTTLVDVAGL